MIVYLDLDRTILKTTEAAEAVWQKIAELYPNIDTLRPADEQDRYYEQVDDMTYYLMSQRLEDLGLIPEDVYSQIATSELADGRFQFDGATELIQDLQRNGYDPVVLTFGMDDYQRFKVSLCPALRGLDVITTRRPKAEFVEDSDTECWVVDDKAIGDELSGLASFVQVSLEGKPVDDSLDWPVFTSLGDVKRFFVEVRE